MAQQIINIGTLPNDGQGDPLRVAYSKINDNFTEVYGDIGSMVTQLVAGSGITISPITGIGVVTINASQVLEVDGEGATVINPDQLIVDGGYA